MSLSCLALRNIRRAIPASWHACSAARTGMIVKLIGIVTPHFACSVEASITIMWVGGMG